MADDTSGLLDGIDRRTLLQSALTASAAAGIGIPLASGTAAAAPTSRRQDAYDNRDALDSELSAPVSQGVGLLDNVSDTSNNDRNTITANVNGTTYLYGVYRKALPSISQADRGVADGDYSDLFNVIDTDGDPSNIPDTSYSPPRAHVEPHAANHFATEGMDPWMATMPPAPSYSSTEMGYSLLDAAWMALYRDEPLRKWDSGYDRSSLQYWSDYQSEMGGASAPWIDTNNTPFRGAFAGSTTGPYLSQFYMHDVQFGQLRMSPTVVPFAANEDYVSPGAMGDDFEAVHEGSYGGAEPNGNRSTPDPNVEPERWIATGRDLASLVRDEPSYLHYFIAAQQLASSGCSFVSADGIEAEQDDSAMRYVNFGGAGLFDALARVAKNALNAAWYHKWLVHSRPRPEAYSADLRNVDPAGALPQVLFDSTLGSGTVMDRLANQYNGYYDLPQAYPEGAPAHPAYPSGHSAIAGACVTALKVFFQDEPLSQLEAFDDSGNAFVANRPPQTPGDTPSQDVNLTLNLSVHDELNKLADNIGVARIWAGVHYWRDHVWGARLGEQVALGTLVSIFNDTGTFSEHAPNFRSLKGNDIGVTATRLNDIRTSAVNGNW